MKNEQYVIGLDFGTDSVRAVLVNVADGTEAASEVHWYSRWRNKEFCQPALNQFRQHPLDHLEGMEASIKGVLVSSGIEVNDVKGICIDTTGSSPLPVYRDGRALAMVAGFEDNPDAMMILWKDHTAISEAAEINKWAKEWGGEDYTKYEGGIYSSEWFWAKILHVMRADAQVKAAAWTWMEHCDWLTYHLISNKDLTTFKRSRCAAGHKAMWHSYWGGLPDDAFLSALDPALVTLKKHLYTSTYTSDQVAGHLSEEWANKLGLSPDVVVAVGTFDAHAGAMGVKAEEHTLVRVMGTSTCDIIVASHQDIENNLVEGICGQVDGSVVPGMIGLEAGQSAFGDALAWFANLLTWPLDHVTSDMDWSEEQKEALKAGLLRQLSLAAEKIPLQETAVVALDWINGRRTPDANQALKAAITNLTLGTEAPHIFKALVEAICFGAKKIVDRFVEEGVHIDSVIGIGGVAKKSPYIMQTLANVLNMPIKVAACEQAPALGAAIYAAVAAGLYTDVLAAAKNMGSKIERVYEPMPEVTPVYASRYRQYSLLGNFVETSTINSVKEVVHD